LLYLKFLIDRQNLIEVDGKNKTVSQISGQTNARLELDGIETGMEKRVPLYDDG
jgi:hypothetical protein